MLFLVNIHIITAILMLVGVYLTIKYTPRCIINLTQMRLLKKSILNESMQHNEIKILDNYTNNATNYNIGSFLLFLSILIHIITIIEILDEHISVLHYIAIACSILIYTARSGYRSTCFRTMFYPDSILQTSDENTLKGINLYLKYLRGEELTEDELKSYKAYKYDVKEVIIIRFIINIGVISLLLLDIFYGFLHITISSLND